MVRPTTSIKIDKHICDFLQQHMASHPELGHRSITAYIEDILRDEVKRLQDKGT